MHPELRRHQRRLTAQAIVLCALFGAPFVVLLASGALWDGSTRNGPMLLAGGMLTFGFLGLVVRNILFNTPRWMRALSRVYDEEEEGLEAQVRLERRSVGRSSVPVAAVVGGPLAGARIDLFDLNLRRARAAGEPFAATVKGYDDGCAVLVLRDGTTLWQQTPFEYEEGVGPGTAALFAAAAYLGLAVLVAVSHFLLALRDPTELHRHALLSELALVVTGPNGSSRTRAPIFTAIERNDGRLAQRLVRHGARFDVRDPQTRETPVQMAVRYRRAEILRLVLAHGGAPDVPDDRGEVPLGHALASRRPDLVRVLLEGGADPARLRDDARHRQLVRQLSNMDEEVHALFVARGGAALADPRDLPPPPPAPEAPAAALPALGADELPLERYPRYDAEPFTDPDPLFPVPLAADARVIASGSG
ncbi:MAG: ankyrin repeat domain-containing protein, partial [Myxococcales bacterium]